SSFPKKNFRKPRDQNVYDSIRDADTLLHDAIQENSVKKIQEVQDQLKLRAFTLRVAEEEGWKVAAKIPKPTSGVSDEFQDLLQEARKSARLEERVGCYNQGGWFNKRENYRRAYFAPYPQ
ncbi:17574_t:CDS:1, partial [Racocetra fulgida]